MSIKTFGTKEVTKLFYNIGLHHEMNTQEASISDYLYINVNKDRVWLNKVSALVSQQHLLCYISITSAVCDTSLHIRQA